MYLKTNAEDYLGSELSKLKFCFNLRVAGTVLQRVRDVSERKKKK